MQTSDVLIAPATLCSFKHKQPKIDRFINNNQIFRGGAVYTFKEITTHIVSSKTGKSFQSIKKIEKTLTVPSSDSSLQHDKKCFTIKQFPAFVSGLTGSITCAAYGNDSMYYNLHTLYKNLNKSSCTNASLALTPLTQGKPNHVIFFVKSSINPYILNDLIFLKGMFKNTKHRASLLRLINLYVRIPWILLDPSDEAEAYAKKVKPALKIHIRCLSNSPDIYVGFKFPITVLVTPFLHWWVSVMIREAFTIWVTQFLHKESRIHVLPTDLEKDLLNAVKGINLTKIINTHDWDKAKQIWSNLCPVFKKYNPHSSTSNAWSATNITQSPASGELISLPKLLEVFSTLGGLTALEIPSSFQATGNPLARNYQSLQDFYHTLAVSAWSLDSSAGIQPHAKTAFGLQGWLRETKAGLGPNLPSNKIVFRVPATAQKLNDKCNSIELEPFKTLTAHKTKTLNKHNVPR